MNHDDCVDQCTNVIEDWYYDWLYLFFFTNSIILL